MAAILATLFGVGRLPAAPGTWGSLVAWLAAGVLLLGLGPVITALLLTALSVGLWFAVAATLPHRQDPDPSEIVADEAVGQWIALAPLLILSQSPATSPVAWVLALAAFRFFDIFKPGPIRKAEQLPGAAGVMLDDCVAGLAAALVTALWIGVSTYG